jgi:hypothetical protein
MAAGPDLQHREPRPGRGGSDARLVHPGTDSTKLHFGRKLPG